MSTNLILEPNGVPYLPIDTRTSKIVCDFAGTYAGMVPNLSQPKVPTYAVILLAQAMTLALLQAISTKASETEELARLAFSYSSRGNNISRTPDLELERNRRSYLALSRDANTHKAQGGWLVFADGEKVSEGSTQRRALLQARNALREKPNVRVFIFRRGGAIRHLECGPERLALGGGQGDSQA